MDPVKIPCPYAPECQWQSIPLEFDKALILVEQHVKFKHPEAAEQSAKVKINKNFQCSRQKLILLQGTAKIVINFNMNDVTSFVSKSGRKDKTKSRDATVKKKRGRPAKKPVTDSDSDSFAFDSDEDLIQSAVMPDLNSDNEQDLKIIERQKTLLKQSGTLSNTDVITSLTEANIEKHFALNQQDEEYYCNYCSFHTNQNLQTLIKHLYTHYPDICGFACLVCRKPEMSLESLLKHLKNFHEQDVLNKCCLFDLKHYENNFSCFSEEQQSLRGEELCRVRCQDCKSLFWSQQRITIHKQKNYCDIRQVLVFKLHLFFQNNFLGFHYQESLKLKLKEKKDLENYASSIMERELSLTTN